MAEENAANVTSTRAKRYGFIIYRAEYSDKAQWERFLAFLKHQVRTALARDGNNELYNLIDWKVQSSPNLQDAGPEEIWKRFNEWLESGEEDPDDIFRYRACVLVNEACLDSVDFWMEGKSLEKDDEMKLFDERGFSFVYLVSRYKSEGYTAVGVSYLIPRAADLIDMQGEGVGWEAIAVPEGEVATP